MPNVRFSYNSFNIFLQDIKWLAEKVQYKWGTDTISMWTKKKKINSKTSPGVRFTHIQGDLVTMNVSICERQMNLTHLFPLKCWEILAVLFIKQGTPVLYLYIVTEPWSYLIFNTNTPNRNLATFDACEVHSSHTWLDFTNLFTKCKFSDTPYLPFTSELHSTLWFVLLTQNSKLASICREFCSWWIKVILS